MTWGILVCGHTVLSLPSAWTDRVPDNNITCKSPNSPTFELWVAVVQMAQGRVPTRDALNTAQGTSDSGAAVTAQTE